MRCECWCGVCGDVDCVAMWCVWMYVNAGHVDVTGVWVCGMDVYESGEACCGYGWVCGLSAGVWMWSVAG